jgi:putative Holliday junction resolvase
MIVAAIDFGRKRIGIAISGAFELVTPVATIEQHSRESSLAAVKQCLIDSGVEQVIVGWPLNMNGTAGNQARAAERFADALRLTTGLPVELYDERLTSFEARVRMRELPSRGKQRPSVDAIAACVILESWLQSRKA